MSVTTQAYLDAENESIVLRNLDDTGAVIPTLPQVRMNLVDLQYADQVSGKAIEAIFRRVHFGGQRCYGLFTIPESDATDDGHGSAIEDLYIGPTMMVLVSYNQDQTHGDYLLCTPPGGGSNVKVAVEPQLQTGITTETTPDGNVWSYAVLAAQKRSATCTSGSSVGTVLTEYITPPFIAGNIIPVQACVNPGVTVGGVTLRMVALTGRNWGGG